MPLGGFFFDDELFRMDIAFMRKDMSLREFARKADIDHVTLHRVEKGIQKDMTIERYLSIANFLGNHPSRYFRYKVHLRPNQVLKEKPKKIRKGNK